MKIKNVPTQRSGDMRHATCFEVFAEVREIAGGVYDDVDDIVGYVNSLRGRAGGVKQLINISGQIHSSKNSRRILPTKSRARPFVLAKSKRAKADEAIIDYQLRAQIETWREMTRWQDYPLRVAFRFIRATRSRWDFANLVQGISDAMVRAGYIPDDDVSHFIPVFAGWAVDRDNPGCQFWILDAK